MIILKGTNTDNTSPTHLKIPFMRASKFISISNQMYWDGTGRDGSKKWIPFIMEYQHTIFHELIQTSHIFTDSLKYTAITDNAKLESIWFTGKRKWKGEKVHWKTRMERRKTNYNQMKTQKRETFWIFFPLPLYFLGIKIPLQLCGIVQYITLKNLTNVFQSNGWNFATSVCIIFKKWNTW